MERSQSFGNLALLVVPKHIHIFKVIHAQIETVFFCSVHNLHMKPSALPSCVWATKKTQQQSP